MTVNPEIAVNKKQPEVRLWLWSVAELTDLAVTRLLRTLSEAEQIRYRDIKAPRRRREYLAGHALLRFALSDLCPEWSQHHQLGLVPGHRLELAGPEARTFDFNLSHSGGFVACAVARHCQLGVDIEVPKRARDYSRLVSEFFAESESKQFFALPEAHRKSAFYTLWTLKESHIKARKTGISAAELARPFVSVYSDVGTSGWFSYSFCLNEALSDEVFGAITLSQPLSSPLPVQEFVLGEDGNKAKESGRVLKSIN